MFVFHRHCVILALLFAFEWGAVGDKKNDRKVLRQPPSTVSARSGKTLSIPVKKLRSSPLIGRLRNGLPPQLRRGQMFRRGPRTPIGVPNVGNRPGPTVFPLGHFQWGVVYYGWTFFGIPTTETHISFIVDNSGSMHDPDPIGSGQTRAKLLLKELKNKLWRLRGDKFFHVNLYGTDDLPMESEGWLQATHENKMKVLAWLDVKLANGMGSTRPGSSIRYSFTKLNPYPKAQFLLTDGEFKGPESEGRDQPMALYRLVNPRLVGCTVNTFCFGSKSSEDKMRKIAEENNGQYRFVPNP